MSMARARVRSSLIYSDPSQPGVTRAVRGSGFCYRRPDGVLVGEAERRRIENLVIPPAWADVWICPDPHGHIQAIGFDVRRRRQYLYHERFRRKREAAKFENLARFAAALPKIRRRIARDIARAGHGREKILATVVRLLEGTLIRVGNASYARENKTYGLTTLKARHVRRDGLDLRLQFKGKNGKEWIARITDRRAARVVRACQELPGQHLFQYLDDAGERRVVDSSDVNAYVQSVAGAKITAKDFRTWAATVLAFRQLRAMSADGAPASKRIVSGAIARVAALLGNTPAVCRSSYIHPAIVDAYWDGSLADPALDGAKARGLTAAEAAVLKLLASRRRPRKTQSRNAAPKKRLPPRAGAVEQAAQAS